MWEGDDLEAHVSFNKWSCVQYYHASPPLPAACHISDDGEEMTKMT